ncbi:CrcB family protein [Gluconobacter morbifer]|uniref:Fluoride-specific ion channel FluC n=1 Tax=Gluconobacter morbifer G707 TaxID=1088869 RepID=G6XFK8_9PROT|nr:CrcB family protein [Gluconobacter morbifer]EHH68966.1 hypothetical protein GMO_02730 [Gluconobacter morbifer G707]
MLQTYLLIALGGAIGSVGRAWVGAVLAPVTGSALPWPTVFINIVGSFIIAYVGMLTAADSRFAGSPELRAFLMVGICGGFTTFSSFTQQTLDLLRDGRPAAAFGNIVLSVMACLLAAMAGYALATQTRVSGLASPTRTASLTSPVPTVLALRDPRTAEGTLRSVRTLVGPQSPIGLLAFDTPLEDNPLLDNTESFSSILSPARLRTMKQQNSLWSESLKERLRPAGQPVSWTEVRGDGSTVVQEQARTAGLVVLEHDPVHTHYARRRLAASLLRASRPTLLLPAGRQSDIGRSIALITHPEDRASMETVLAPWLKRATCTGWHDLPSDPQAMTRLVQDFVSRGTDLLAISPAADFPLRSELVDQTLDGSGMALLFIARDMLPRV